MIEFRDVRKAFGAKRVLDGVSFSIAPGEIVFFIGRSGTGKSVLLKHIVGLLDPDGGSVSVDGDEVSTLSEEDRLRVRRRCGMVFQFPALLDSLTVEDNLTFGLRALKLCASRDEESKRVREALGLVKLGSEWLPRYPAELSFGVQKRVSIARAVALKPKHLLFDEPTTGLDPVATNAVNRLIADLSREIDVTAVVVSHDMHCALAVADRILLLDGGKVAVDGSPTALLKSEHPVARAFLQEARARGGKPST